MSTVYCCPSQAIWLVAAIVAGLCLSAKSFQPHALLQRRSTSIGSTTKSSRLQLLLSMSRSTDDGPMLTPFQQERRRILLNRNGPYFELDRFKGTVQFGSTANLVTKLTSTPSQASIAGWLSEERRVALSIWDPSLMQEMDNAVYRLQLMTLQFVTITLQPTVDVKMWTADDDKDNQRLPVFSLQSVAFDPNLQILPGLGVKAESLGIVIEVVGDLRPTADFTGVTGKIAFQSGGELPPPMRLLPEPALKAASDTICNTVSKFAIDSFQKGAIAKYKEYAATEAKAATVAQQQQE